MQALGFLFHARRCAAAAAIDNLKRDREREKSVSETEIERMLIITDIFRL